MPDRCTHPESVRLLSALCAAAAAFAGVPVSASAQSRATGTAILFDIPAQPLASALEAYSIAGEREVVYNGNLAVGRRSLEVRGVFTSEDALERLLRGTGLSPRYMAADAFVLIPDKTSERAPANAHTGAPPPMVFARYYGRIQASLRRAFCANARTQPGNYRVAVSFWIGSSGTINRTELLGSTGVAIWTERSTVQLMACPWVRRAPLKRPKPAARALRAPKVEGFVVRVGDCPGAMSQSSLSGGHASGAGIHPGLSSRGP